MFSSLQTLTQITLIIKKKYKLNDKNLLNSTSWGQECITLPFHLKITPKQQFFVIKTLKQVLIK